jgi:hypothetical protein
MQPQPGYEQLGTAELAMLQMNKDGSMYRKNPEQLCTLHLVVSSYQVAICLSDGSAKDICLPLAS